MTEQDKKTIQLLAGSNSVLEDRNKLLKKENKKLKEQLRIADVSQQRELLEAFVKQIKEDNELTEEITFQDINKCIASNCG
jgi:oligoribonuclease (3'-5' exoribonuclease)